MPPRWVGYMQGVCVAEPCNATHRVPRSCDVYEDGGEIGVDRRTRGGGGSERDGTGGGEVVRGLGLCEEEAGT
jgi:hypothetical protein